MLEGTMEQEKGLGLVSPFSRGQVAFNIGLFTNTIILNLRMCHNSRLVITFNLMDKWHSFKLRFVTTVIAVILLL